MEEDTQTVEEIPEETLPHDGVDDLHTPQVPEIIEPEEKTEEKTEETSQEKPAEPVPLSPEEMAGLEARLVTVKVNGEERQVPLKEAIDNYQKTAAAQEKFSEAKRLKEEALAERDKVESQLGQLRTWFADLKEPANMGAMLERAGFPFRQAAEAYIADLLEYEKLSPDQRELREIKHKMQVLEQEREAERRRQEQATAQSETKRIQQEFQGWMEAAIQAEAATLDDDDRDYIQERTLMDALVLVERQTLTERDVREIASEWASKVKRYAKAKEDPVPAPAKPKPPAPVKEGMKKPNGKTPRAKRQTISEFFESFSEQVGEPEY